MHGCTGARGHGAVHALALGGTHERVHWGTGARGPCMHGRTMAHTRSYRATNRRNTAARWHTCTGARAHGGTGPSLHGRTEAHMHGCTSACGNGGTGPRMHGRTMAHTCSYRATN